MRMMLPFSAKTCRTFENPFVYFEQSTIFIILFKSILLRMLRNYDNEYLNKLLDCLYFKSFLCPNLKSC